LDTSGDFRGYLESFSAKKRYTLLKKRRILGNQEEFSVKEVTAAHEIERYYDILVSLHVERAARKGIRSAFSSEKAASFHKKLISTLGKKGTVVLSLLYKKDIPLAAYYCYRHNRKYYFYQSGISREGEEHSAGVVLLSRMIQKSFDEGYQEFDFLRGAEEYKEYWTQTVRKNLYLGIAKQTSRGKLTRMILGWQKKMAIAGNQTQQLLLGVKGRKYN
jgi:CelD/BcsL family acetyltransferase involved in cellulose biosynthesis